MSDLPPSIDPHHHLWDLERHYYPWLSDPMKPSLVGDYSMLRHSYLAADFLADIARQNVVKSVHLEAGHDKQHPVVETEAQPVHVWVRISDHVTTGTTGY